MHVAFKSTRAVPVQVQDHIFHLFNLIQGQFEGDLMLLIREDRLVLNRRYQQGLVVQESWGTDQHVT